MPYYLPICNRNPNCCPIMELDIKGPTGSLMYFISGNCCQKSVWCVGPCQEFGCKVINYEIRDTSKQVVGMIRNLWNECDKECCSKADKFGVEFPKNISNDRKILIMQAAIWLDYLQYYA